MANCHEPWRAGVIKRTTEEWQARLVIFCQQKDMEEWKVTKIPDIMDENIAVEYLFTQKSEKIPKWKFDLCVKLCQDGENVSILFWNAKMESNYDFRSD